MIILLDLNFTLVDLDHREARVPLSVRLLRETYRFDLVEACRPHTTVLVTARPARWRQPTLDRIKELTGWQPEDAHFNDLALPPPQFKEHALLDRIFPKYGEDAGYVAVESNPATRAMYATHGIAALPYADFITSPHATKGTPPPWEPHQSPSTSST